MILQEVDLQQSGQSQKDSHGQAGKLSSGPSRTDTGYYPRYFTVREQQSGAFTSTDQSEGKRDAEV